MSHTQYLSLMKELGESIPEGASNPQSLNRPNQGGVGVGTSVPPPMALVGFHLIFYTAFSTCLYIGKFQACNNAETVVHVCMCCVNCSYSLWYTVARNYYSVRNKLLIEHCIYN